MFSLFYDPIPVITGQRNGSYRIIDLGSAEFFDH